MSFTITITNDGDTWLTEVPLHDEYFTEYLQYVDSVPPSTSDDASNPTGTIDWDDLTDTFGDLAPDESFTIIVNFIALKDTVDSPNGVTVNTAEVQGAKADPDGDGPLGSVIPLPDKSDSDDVRILKTTGVGLTRLETMSTDGSVIVSWETLNEFYVIGFNVLRARRVTGGSDYVTMNEELIVAEYAGGGQGKHYHFQDNDVEIGVTYEYKLKVLSIDGSAIQFQLPTVTTRG